MELIKLYCNRFPLKGYIAFTFFPWVFIRKDLKKKYTENVERHESAHALQQIECLLVFFYLFYMIEYIVKLLCTFSHKKAYYSISFEQEAYEHEAELFYNSVRKHYAWIKYVFKLK